MTSKANAALLALCSIIDHAKEQGASDLRTVLMVGLDRIGDRHVAFNVKKETIDEIKRWCNSV